MKEIDIEKLKQWLEYKSNEILESNVGEDNDWSWGMKFAFDWVIDVINNKEFYDNILLDLERWEENEEI